MTTLEDILDQLHFSATDARDKGDRFERLMLQFFRTDLQWVDRFSEVWPWMEWPDRHGKPDTGIDLVAKDATTGDTVAIQCKFYDPAHYLAKGDIDSFLSASGKYPFGQRLIVSTTDRWGKNAEDTIENQQVPVQRLRFMDLAESSIDWSLFDLSTPQVMALKDRKQLRPHQKTAVAKVVEGFQTHDRGKLIMACGTGKTFTSLKIAEQMVPVGGSVLFLVPSISLLSQSLREWALEAEVDLRPFAVCSDTKVGKRRGVNPNEDISVVDLPLPATTNPARLHQHLSNTAAGAGKVTVVFSTYQSIEVVAQAQAMGGVPGFDLVVCDEAHRTTGTTLAGEDESAFVRVHDNTFLKAAKRLYMTATPRIYDDASKAKAGQVQAVLASMDDKATYGPEFHRLGFGEAVSKGLLTDYKVLVLAVDEKEVSATFQAQLADENSELRLDDLAKIVGCWNGLAKRGQGESGFGEDTAPMTRAVAFAGTIAKSQQFARMFGEVVDDYLEHQRIVTGPDDDTDDADDDATDVTGDGGAGEGALRCEVAHVDGTFNVLVRNERLDWLKASTDPGTCRVLSNARCLSEGVDVPALDSVMFLNPRKSVVDVVQSVGRVMRLSPGKKYGYIILPIGIPAGMAPEDALRDNTRYAVVWEVLQALRAHDERFNAMINKIELNAGKDSRVQIIGVGGGDDREPGEAGPTPTQGALNLEWLDQWREAIYAKIVTKVGDRRYWEDWAKDVSVIASRHTTRITALLDDPALPVHEEFDRFLTGLRANLNDSIGRDDAIDMLAQHLITRPVFDALFEGYSFTEHNPVSRVMQSMLDTLDAYNLHAENETLDRFYESVRLRAEGIDNAEGKQRIVAELYEKFFKVAFPKTAESLGIVYTPVQIVDFILRSVEHLLGTEFGVSLSDEGVHVLDPFTGTGTFVTRLLQSGLIAPHDLARKYTSEIHANEILLLAYYIAAINIEATYHAIRAEVEPDAGYEPFIGIVLTDTFQMTEDGDTLDTTVFPANNERAAHQLDLDIRVIVGNPPWSMGQGHANDDNQNLRYPTLDAAIRGTYAERSRYTNKVALYDSYIRAIRWASDRIKDAGVIGFVTNGGFLDANTADGLRKTLAEEFAAIYVFNLRGNQRTAGELSRREGGKVFGAGSRNTVAVTFLVKNPGHTGPAAIHHRDIGECLTREQKLDIIAHSDLALLDWQTITPNDAGDWTRQRSATFEALRPIGHKGSADGVFVEYSGGLSTSRDAWAYGFSREKVRSKMESLVSNYNEQVAALRRQATSSGVPITKLAARIADNDPRRVSWSTVLRSIFARGQEIEYDPSGLMQSVYRPFTKQVAHRQPQLNHSAYRLPKFFPVEGMGTVGFFTNGFNAQSEFCVLAMNVMPSLDVFGKGGAFFGRWTYVRAPAGARQEELSFTEDVAEARGEYRRVDNVNPATVAEYRAAYGGEVTSDDVFYYVYGLLHSTDYREAFAADLKKMLPRIPKVPGAEDFRAFVAAGRQLAELHVGYESVAPYPLTVTGDQPAGPGSADRYGWFRVEKMGWGGNGKAKDRSAIVYNPRITVSGIPDEAHEYLLGSRSGIEWVMERYQVKTDKASGIVNDPNDWSREVGDPRYILDLIARVVTVSVETVQIVRSLPSIDFEALS